MNYFSIKYNFILLIFSYFSDNMDATILIVLLKGVYITLENIVYIKKQIDILLHGSSQKSWNVTL